MVCCDVMRYLQALTRLPYRTYQCPVNLLYQIWKQSEYNMLNSTMRKTSPFHIILLRVWDCV